jgi:shikimate dehydrogenase
VLGSPIAHSLSPQLHLAAYRALGLDWSYDRIECDEAGLPELVERCRRDRAWAGLSLTMPLKEAALQVADERDRSAEQLGVANTLVFADGRATAYNTDVGGLVAALAELGVTSAPVDAVVLGGGGTARAAMAALAELGAHQVAVAVRRPEAAAPLMALGERLDVQVEGRPWPTTAEELAGADVVLATTPAGATDPLAATGWPAGVPLLEVLYAPWPTGLAAAAVAAGAPVVGGLSMLVGQAARQVELTTGRPAPVAVMRAAGEAALAARTHGE